MQNRWFTFLVSFLVLACGAYIVHAEVGEYSGGQDLHLSARSMTVYESQEAVGGEHVLLFENGFTMSIGANELFSDSAIVWLSSVDVGYRGVSKVDYNVQVYLEGNVSVAHGVGSKTADVSEITVEQGQSLVSRFLVTGEIFATAGEQKKASRDELDSLSIYENAAEHFKPVISKPIIAREAMVPGLDVDGNQILVAAAPEHRKPFSFGKFFGFGDKDDAAGSEADGSVAVKQDGTDDEAVKVRYPVNLAALWDPAPKVETTSVGGGGNVATVIGRFYLWQKQDEKGGMLEFQADSAVMFYDGKSLEVGKAQQADVLASGSLNAIYLRGNIVMTEQGRTVRADEIYYDFANKRAIAVKAEMRKFDEGRGIPIYLRAETLRKVSDNVFQADNITLTTSEFYLPQISMTASKLVLTDLTGVDSRVDDSKYDAVLYDVRMKGGTKTFFKWPKLRTDFERPDVPIKRISVGDSSDRGFSIETRWYLSRLLGIKEPEGVNSDLLIDYYGDRGLGAGALIEYEKEDSFGWVNAYVLRDRGEDDLGRTDSRKNLDPDRDLRGRFTTRHRQYLPYNWQVTTELSYISDENFLESFYRQEFKTEKEQETLLHLKRLEDNWAFSFLAKARINDFQTQTEELPTIEFHHTGESFWDHSLTYYGDTQVSRFRERFGSGMSGSEPFYTYFSTRHEVDMPMTAGLWKVVPFVAGTYGFDDHTGFTRDLDDNPAGSDDSVFLGEGGVRLSTMFWKADSSIRSQKWDIDGLRHVVEPHVEAVVFAPSDDTIDMRNMVNFGLSQRWQTHRGPEYDRRSLDWMTLDVDAIFVDESLDTESAPAKFMWNNPAIPMLARRGTSGYGIFQNSINADYTWRLSDTTTILSDMNYDLHSGVIQQFDLGFARYVYPDISYYLGTRYLRPVVVSVPADGVYEEGSNSFIASISYRLNERYTATFAQQYNFDYGKNVRSELTILRRYHRMYYGLTFGLDESRDQTMLMFSIWPQGVNELAFGSRKFTSLSENVSED